MIEANRHSMCRAIAITTFIVLCLVTPISGQRGVSQPSPAIDDGRQWFEPDANSSTHSRIQRGAIAAAFNESSAEQFLREIIKSKPRSDDASRAHELLSRIYLRTGQYKRLIENLDRWAALFPNLPEVHEEKSDVEQFRGLPDQRNDRRRFSTLRHGPDDWGVPISINGKPATYLFDTGAWMSVMTESEAARLGLEIRLGSGRLSDPSGKGLAVQTAVARDVRIGAMRLRNVSFAILPKEGPWSSLPAGEGGILGMPVWLAVGHVKWSSRGTWELGGRSEIIHRASRNLVFFENKLLLATSVSGKRVFGTVDTGANGTDLNEHFANEFAALVKNGRRQTRDITGLGGTTSVASIIVPEVPFQIGPTRVFLRPAHVTLQRTAAIGGTCCIGNIGRDVLAQTGEFLLDLSAMVLRLSSDTHANSP